MTTHGRNQEGNGDGGTRPPRAHLSTAGLRARGWTPAMVRRLLGEPDLTRPNPYVRCAPHTRLYRLERVEAAERSDGFRAVSAAARRISTLATATAAGRRGRREARARIAAARGTDTWTPRGRDARPPPSFTVPLLRPPPSRSRSPRSRLPCRSLGALSGLSRGSLTAEYSGAQGGLRIG
ncbi:hypothetical protein JCM4814A_59870 [Streptomyces phaeofaciens JCM 4814]|uniref:Uncharacterized protein n=1 Tax=Streptomyces phaeofaciens TaxID=68254 RepID=A0A918HN51_9ACTN|nr:hypothetical protein GCM10010226_71060 [Streptomyces phaeofaciens]